jgi:hypothetical protein
VPKKPTKAPKTETPAADGPGTAPSETKPDAVKRASRSATKGKRNGTAAPKKPSTPRASKARKKAAGTPAVQPSNEEIQLRAYFISERRHRLDLPGDATSDWVEAKRQLVAEARPK